MRCFPHPHACSIVEHNFKRLDIIGCSSSHLRMNSTGVISDHAPNRAPPVCCWVRDKGEMMLFRCLVKVDVNDTGLNTSQLPLGINLKNPVHVLCVINDDRYIAALSRQARSAAAGCYRSAKFPAERERFTNVLLIAWKDNANWGLAIIRAIRRVKRTETIIKSHLPFQFTF